LHAGPVLVRRVPVLRGAPGDVQGLGRHRALRPVRHPARNLARAPRDDRGDRMSPPGAAITATRVDVPALLRSRLAALAPHRLDILDDSAAHAGHAGAAGGGGHFSLTIVSNVFSGLSRLERHQRVLREVADLVPYPIHALSIRA